MAASVLENLKSVSMYPIPIRTLNETIERRGLRQEEEATQEVMRGAKYNLALADILIWLSLAPDISQGGQSFSFTDEQRIQFRNRANKLKQQYQSAAEAALDKPTYGYKGSRL